MAFANDPIKHVVVLMLENRSFDHLLGDLSRLQPGRGIIGIDPGFTNPFPGDGLVPPRSNAIASLPRKFDPKHEHPNVVRQLGSLGAPTMQGFLEDAEAELGQASKLKFPQATIEQVMAYFPAETEVDKDPLPALRTLARQFLVCDQWFSSVPGPTWPNRFFSLTGTAAGHLRMPGSITDIGLLFKSYDMPTIFNRMHDKGLRCKIFHDGVSLAMLLRQTWRHASMYDGMDDFFEAAAGDPREFPEFAFIEPQYFSLFGNQNDQHPPHDMRRGDQLIAKVYNAIRQNEALWNETLLVILYDEHGGFCDHVPPPTSVSPDDIEGDVGGFRFDRLGVRVPAVLVSSHVDKADVDHTEYDHTSLLAYLCRKWDLEPLGKRCARANSFEAVIREDLVNVDSPQSVRVVDLGKTRDLLAAELEPNENQRALALMVDFVNRYLEAPNDSASFRALDGQVQFSAERVLRKSQQAFALMKELSPPSEPVPRPGRLRERAAGRPLEVLMVHGVGHGDADLRWQSQWQEAFRHSAIVSGYAGVDRIEFNFARFDDIFEKFPLDAVTIMRGLTILGRDALLPDPVFGKRDLVQRGLLDTVRWTAGMVLQWIENEQLRAALNQRLMEEFHRRQYDIVCAHSLGGMACYDAFRSVISKREGGQFDGVGLITFGSQLANPAVHQVFGGRIEPLYDEGGHGFKHWFHLYNPHDHVFTRPLPGGDQRTHSLDAEFDIPGDVLNHDGQWYLGHRVTANAVLPSLLDTLDTRAISTPRVLTNLSRPSQRRALLVGINDYPNPEMRLNGCVNDVYLMSAVLQECGFEAEDIRILTDRRATKSALLERLDWLADGVSDEDERVFFYSGHGAQLPDYGNAGEPDKVYETLVPSDFDWSRQHAFTDEEFYQYYSHLPYDSRFMAIFDCCHAGGMTRGGQRVRGIDPPDDVQHRAIRWNPRHEMWVPRDFVDRRSRFPRAFDSRRKSGAPSGVSATRRGLGESGLIRNADDRAMKQATTKYGHQGPYMPVLIYAAGQSELAAEYTHGSVAYGAFTFAMAKQLRKRRAEPTFTRLVHNVRGELVDLGYQQTPEIVGPSARVQSKVPIFRWRDR